MEIKPGQTSRVSLYTQDMTTGGTDINDTEITIKKVYEELVEINEKMKVELQGSMKAIFGNAKDTSEKKVNRVCGIMNNLSVQLDSYVLSNNAINSNSFLNAGGMKNE